MILVTGATGFLGRHLIKKLEEKKISYKALVRNKEISHKNYIYGNLLDKESLEKATHLVDIIIHLAAVIDEENKNLFRVNLTGTKNLIELAEKEKIKQFIFISSSLVSFENLENDYIKSKKQAEEILKNSNLNWTILRPTLIYGSGDKKNLSMILNFIRKSPVVPIFSGSLYLQPVFVNDVVQAILASLNNKRAYKKIYNIGGPSLLTLAKIEEQIIKKINKPKFKLYVPFFMIEILLKIKKFLPKTFQKKLSTLNRLKQLSFLRYDEVRRDLDFKPIDFNSGLDLIIK